jgi:hypothetical protein
VAIDLPETDLTRVQRWCQQRIPERAQHQVRLAHEVRGHDVILVERRVSWDAPDTQFGPRWKVPLPVAIRDQLGELFTDEAFGAAFAARGKPGWSPGRLALVTVLGDGREPDRPASCGGGAGEDLVEIRAGNDAERPGV